MPLVAHNAMPTFERLRQEGLTVLSSDFALQQEIREMHIGLLNMMPDKALTATERQFFRLIGHSNPIAQFRVHPFTLPELPRSAEAQAHIDAYYEPFEQLREEGLDALIITGANVIGPELSTQPFWKPLNDVVAWAAENVTSTLCSCLATHAVLEMRHAQKRRPQPEKIWGVFPHRVLNQRHPLVTDVNAVFDVPHSRWNAITRRQFEDAGLDVLVEFAADTNKDDSAGVHLAVSNDGLRFVFFQGHPEYDTISLLKEYKREVLLFATGKRESYPPFPEHYFKLRERAILQEYALKLQTALKSNAPIPDFPEHLVSERFENAWHDTAEAVVGNWIGAVYQITSTDRRIPFMSGVDPHNPLRVNAETFGQQD